MTDLLDARDHKFCPPRRVLRFPELVLDEVDEAALKALGHRFPK
jgi:hypothetical protein